MKWSRFPVLKQIFLGGDKKNLVLFVTGLTLNTFAALFEGLSFGFIMLSLTMLSHSSDSVHSSYSGFLNPAKAFDFLGIPKSFTFFLISAILFQVIRSGLNYFGQIISIYLGTRVQTEAQKRVYQQIFRFSFSHVNRYKLGDLIEYSKIPTLLMGVLIDPLNRFVVASLTIGASILTMFFLSVPLTFLAAIIFGCLAVSQKFVISKIQHISQSLTACVVDFTQHTTQSLNGLRAVHTFSRQKNVLEKIGSTLEKMAYFQRKLSLWAQSIAPINEIMGIFLVGVFLLTGQWISQDKELDILPTLLTFVVIVYRLNGRIQLLLSAVGAIASHSGEILRLEDILKDQNKEFTPTEGIAFQSFQGSIFFQNVSLRYPNTKEFAIHQLSIEIEKGATTAFVGSSGAGKSSIIDLLLRLYEPSEGVLLVDGINLNKYQIDSWRANLGVVSQDTYIFGDTIEQNIRFGMPNVSMEKIKEATRIAGAADFIDRLPDGFQTVLGERGHRLSGGERQKISLARALVRDPDILILDEATSNLDSHSEYIIQNALNNFNGKKTIIIVAHRLSTIRRADKIFVLEQGKVVESGTHNSLLTTNGRYAFLWNIQSKEMLQGAGST